MLGTLSQLECLELQVQEWRVKGLFISWGQCMTALPTEGIEMGGWGGGRKREKRREHGSLGVLPPPPGLTARGTHIDNLYAEG